MKLFKVDFIKTNEQERLNGSSDLVELYIDIDSINGLMITKQLIQPGKYSTKVVDGKTKYETIEEPKYTYIYSVALQCQSFPTLNITSASYEALKSILKQKGNI